MGQPSSHPSDEQLAVLAQALEAAQTLTEAALSYAITGFSVLAFEAQPNGGKRPLPQFTHGVYSATRDLETIRRCFDANPGALAAIVIPDDFLVLDIDVKKGKRGDRDFEKIARIRPEKVMTPRARTATGGWHLWLRANGKAYRTLNSLKLKGETFDGLEVRAPGSALVVPSPGSGYRWESPLSVPRINAWDWVPDAAALGPEPATPQGKAKPFVGVELEWAERELQEACDAIAAGGPGDHDAPSGKAFWIGRIVGGGGLERVFAIASLIDAAQRCPGSGKDYQKKVERRFVDGLRYPLPNIEAPEAAPGINEEMAAGADASANNSAGAGTASSGTANAGASSAQPDPILAAYPLTFDGDVDAAPNVPELVEGMLPEVGVALMAGQWGTFKTFAAIDFAYSVMTMTPFAGRPVLRQGGVLFIAAEGAKYVAARLKGVKLAKGDGSPAIVGERMPFAWTRNCPALTKPDAVSILAHIVGYLAAEMQSRFGLPLALIVIDTMTAAAEFKDANDTAENRRVMKMLEALGIAARALVLVVDHFGKDVSTGTRNSSAKEDAADTVLALFGDRTITGVISNTKMAIRKYRSGESGAEIPFKARKVEFPDGLKGTLTIEWEVEPEDASQAKAERAKVWPKKLHTLRAAISETLLSLGFMAHPFLDGPEVRVVKREHVRGEYVRRYPGKSARDAFWRHMQDAVAEGFIAYREIALADGTLEAVLWALRPC